MSAQLLRDRQAALVRKSILEAFITHIESGDADDVSIEQLAAEAGLSRRTVYRRFPTRAELVTAAGDFITSELLGLPIEIGADGIAASFRDATARLRRHPRLARALLRTETGIAVRSGYRRRRVEAIRKALDAEAPTASPAEAKYAAAVLAYLCSSNAWTTIQDESGLSAKDAQAGVTWAIEALIAKLRERTPTKRKRSARNV
jgi:AcrR family transcriptional regulator